MRPRGIPPPSAMSRVIAPDGKVETFAWLAWPSFMMEPLPKLASISPRTRSSAFFLASRSAELFDSDAGAFAAAAGLAGLAGLEADLAAALADEEEEEVKLDWERRREAREPPPMEPVVSPSAENRAVRRDPRASGRPPSAPEAAAGARRRAAETRERVDAERRPCEDERGPVGSAIEGGDGARGRIDARAGAIS